MLSMKDFSNGEVIKIFQGHERPIIAIALNGDGTSLISASDTENIKVWNLATGQVVDEINERGITALAVTPEGRHVGSASEKDISIIDPLTGLQRSLEGHADTVRAVVVAADGQFAISASEDQTLKLWNLLTGNVQTLTGHSDWVSSVALTPDARYAISGSADKTVKVWDVANGREIRTLRGHIGTITAVAITADAKRAISVSRDETIKVWDVSNGAVIASLGTDVPNLCCAIGMQGTVYVVGDERGRVHFLRLEATRPPGEM